MVAVRMVQPAVHEIVEMVTMRHCFVPAVWTVHVRAGDLRRALHGICGVDRDDMFVHVVLVHVVKMAVVKMAVVKVVHMAVMANRGVPAVRAMLVGVIGMMLLGAGRHDVSFLRSEPCRDLWSLFLCSLQATQKGRQLFPEPERISCTRLKPDSAAGRLRGPAVGIDRPATAVRLAPADLNPFTAP